MTCFWQMARLDILECAGTPVGKRVTIDAPGNLERCGASGGSERGEAISDPQCRHSSAL